MQVGSLELLQLKYINKIIFMAQSARLGHILWKYRTQFFFHSVVRFPSTFLPTRTRNTDFFNLPNF